MFTNLANIHLKNWLANSGNVDATTMHQVVEYKLSFCLYKKWYDKLTQSRMGVFSMEDYIDTIVASVPLEMKNPDKDWLTSGLLLLVRMHQEPSKCPG